MPVWSERPMPKVSRGQCVCPLVKASAMLQGSWSKLLQWMVKVSGPGAGVTAVVTDCLVNSDWSSA